MTDLKDDCRMIIYLVEGKIIQSILLLRVVVFTKSSKNGNPMGPLERERERNMNYELYELDSFNLNFTYLQIF